MLYLFLGFALLLVGPVLVVVAGDARLDRDWRTATRQSAEIAPDPEQHRPALVQVYAARAFGWRGAFAVHTWIATKGQGADSFRIHEVMGWHVHRGGDAVVSHNGKPDRYWYGQPPRVIAELRGEAAERAIVKIEALVEAYPYDDRYVMWPGPNSNSFTAYIGRQVPELAMDLPTTAIGKDYLVTEDLMAATPHGEGVQLSLAGLLGVSVSQRSVEFNVLSLNFGVGFSPASLKIPGIGDVGFD